MTDQAPETPSSQPPRGFVGVRKFIFAMGVLFLVWLIFGQIVPRVLFRMHAGNTPAPVVTETAPVPAETTEATETPPATEVPPSPLPVASNDVGGRLDNIEARLKAIEERSSTAVDEKIKALEEKIDAMPQEPVVASDVDDERVSLIEAKLDEQEKNLQMMGATITAARSEGGERLAAMTAFGQIKDAAARGENFKPAFDQLSGLTKNNPQVQELLTQIAPDMDKTPSTLEQLKAQFETIAPQALNPTVRKGSIMGRMYSLVRIRKVGEQAGTDDQSILARAEAKLNRGDVNGSTKELMQLSPPAVTSFANWMNDAERYQRLHNALDALQIALAQDKPAAP